MKILLLMIVVPMALVMTSQACKTGGSGSSLVSDKLPGSPIDGEWFVRHAFHMPNLASSIPMDDAIGKKMTIGDNYSFDGKNRCAPQGGRPEVFALAQESRTFIEIPPPGRGKSVRSPYQIVFKFPKGACTLDGGDDEYLPVEDDFYYRKDEFMVSCEGTPLSRSLPNQYMKLDDETLLGWNSDKRFFCLKAARNEPDPPTNHPPQADAGERQVVRSGKLATLDGSGSTDPDGDTLSFSWSQVRGKKVQLEKFGTATPSFQAPKIIIGRRILAFELRVSDGKAESTSQVEVEVRGKLCPWPIPRGASVPQGCSEIIEE